MKVAIVNKHITHTVGGSELQCDLLARGLSANGHDVLYVAPSQSQSAVTGYDYQVKPVQSNAASLRAELLAARPDIVYWRWNKNHLRVISSSLEKAEIPLVFAVAHVNDLLPWAVKPGSSGIKGRIRKTRRTFQSRWNHAGFSRVSALTSNNSDLLPLSPVRESFYVPNGMISDALPFHWERPYVAWVANIKPAKQPELFIGVAHALNEAGIDAIMVGHMQSNDYEWLSSRAHVPSNLHYLGPRSLPEINGLLFGSRLHVHTCQPEGFSNVFIQAWLQGRPSVSFEFDPGGYIEQYGLGAVSHGNVELFRQHVVEWATDTERSDVVGIRARDLARKDFSVDAIVSRVENILLRILEGREN